MFAMHTLERHHWPAGSRKTFLACMVQERRFGNFEVTTTALWKKQSILGTSSTYPSFGTSRLPL
jgi:hypothetical protein